MFRTTPLVLLAVGGLLADASSTAGQEQPPTGEFESLGIPVQVGRLHATRVGPDADDRRGWVYFAFAQGSAGPPFLLVVDPDRGTIGQYFPPDGCHVRGFKSLYVGGYKPARLLRFDPKTPEQGLRNLGVLPGAGMLWWMQEAADDRLYMTTSSEARLFSWDRETGAIDEHGRLSGENQYATKLLASADRQTLYAVVAPQKYDVVAYDTRTGKRRGLLKEEQRGTGFIGIHRRDASLAAELPGKQFVPFGNRELAAGSPLHELQDGRRTLGSTEEFLLLTDPDTGRQTKRILDYEAGTEIFTLFPGPNGRLYGATHAPLRLFVWDPAAEKLNVLGNPFAHANGSLKAAAHWRGKLVLAAYPRCDLALYDPDKPWDKGPTADHNPWTWGYPRGEGHTRPSGAVLGVDGLVYVGSDSSYGIPGGAVACLDPRTGKTVFNLRKPFQQGSVYSIAAHPDSPILYIGYGGESVIAWDIEKRQVRWEVVPVDGARYISSLNFAADRVCGTTLHDDGYETQHFFMLDAATGDVLHRTETPVAGIVHGNLKLGPDGWLYGLTYVNSTLFRIEPTTGTVQTIARPPRAIGYTVAVMRDGLYFADEATLMCFHFDQPLSVNCD